MINCSQGRCGCHSCLAAFPNSKNHPKAPSVAKQVLTGCIQVFGHTHKQTNSHTSPHSGVPNCSNFIRVRFENQRICQDVSLFLCWNTGLPLQPVHFHPVVCMGAVAGLTLSLCREKTFVLVCSGWRLMSLALLWTVTDMSRHDRDSVCFCSDVWNRSYKVSLSAWMRRGLINVQSNRQT